MRSVREVRLIAGTELPLPTKWWRCERCLGRMTDDPDGHQSRYLLNC